MPPKKKKTKIRCAHANLVMNHLSDAWSLQMTCTLTWGGVYLNENFTIVMIFLYLRKQIILKGVANENKQTE